MKLWGRTPIFALLVLSAVVLGLAGCGPNGQILQGQVEKQRQQQLALTRQNEQILARASSLDRDNQELGTLLAQSRQQTKIYEDQVSAMRQQLSDVATQLAKVREEKNQTEKQVKMMTASMQRRSGVSINPNSSVRTDLPDINLPGVDVRRDGEVIRIVLPADRLFNQGVAQLRSDTTTFLSQVANEVQRVYPNQRIEIQGHTDRQPPSLAGYRNLHELSVAWAVAVENYLSSKTGLRPEQLSVAGHGGNYPAYSNAAPDGAQRNRRVELVIYPDRAS